MRRSSKEKGIEKAGDSHRLEHRSGMLQPDEQRPEEHAGSTEEAVKFLAALTKALIRMNPSSDLLYLAVLRASKEANITKEQADKFVAWVIAEQSNSPWPKGFF